jgi:hypothetical protein
VSDVNANIGIHFDTSDALAQLRRLQAGLSKFNQALTEGNVAAANAQKGLNSQLIQSINATGKFVASQKTIATSTTAFTDALEKNKLSMGQYFRYTAAAATMNSKTLRNLFTQEKDVLKRAMKDRVKTLQTQYVQLTNANGELVKVLQVVPKHLKMVNGQYADYATRTQMAAQRQQFLNQLLKQGSTQLLNFGKNTQWAGRQLMVGLTIPLSILGSTAAKVFREMEEATVRFTRVYGDMLTSVGDTEQAVADIQRLAKEYTKFGIAAKDTMEMAASAAAMGLTGADLQAQVTNATKLAVLGQVEQQQALETTISLQNAFGISAEQLAGKINYLNAVENQTVLSIEDLTIAIPKAGPVVKQLGGSVEDLAFFMTAMKEGGINASEGANALKSGLASMINPSKKASEFLAGLGINIKGLVNANAGDLKATVVGFARALDTLDPLNRARAIEQMFGKFQFARLSTLFQNVTKDSSQAARALGLAGASVEELAILSERELGKVENAVGVKFQKQLENLKIQLMPIGKAFLEAITPIVQFAGKILEKFNNLSDGTKKFVVGFIGIIGGIAPVVLMTVGLVANGVANLIKFFAMLRGGVAKLNGQNNVLGGGFDYLTQAETENLAQTQALHVSHTDLISTFNVEKTSVDLLAAAYQNAASQARALASGSPGLFNASPGPKGAVSGLPKFADGKVPGNESEGDSILALVAPGETIVPTALSKKYAPLLKAIMGDDLPGFIKGKTGLTEDDNAYVSSQSGGAGVGVVPFIKKELARIRDMEDAELIKYAEATGQTVTDTSVKSMESIRSTIIESFKKIVDDTKKEFGELTKEGLETVGKKRFSEDRKYNDKGELTPGSSIMGQWAPKFMQPYKKEFGHVGQTERVESSKLSLNEEAQRQVDAIREFYDKKGKAAPDLKVADAHGMGLLGTLNGAMSEPARGRGYEKDNGVGSLGQDLEKDFKERGVDKWREMTAIMGKDFEALKGQAQVYDDALAARLKEWNEVQQQRIANNEPPELMTDDVFAKLEYEVRSGIKDQIPEWNALIESAKQAVTEIRISVGEDLAELNTFLETKGFRPNSLGKSTGNSKILNTAVRGNIETGKPDGELLGTQPLHEQGAPKIEATPEAIASAKEEGAKLGQAAIDGSKSSEGADTQSPSKKGKKVGKDIADGIIEGMQEGQPQVEAQSARLGDAAVPTAAQTQAKVDKMDLGNKAFYDDINTPEMRDERQILKSLDRQRRKRGAGGTVGVDSDPSSSTSIVSVSAETRLRTQAAADQLAVKTEEAVTAQTQVVQQIRDESKTRVKIKGNTINIGQAREEADKAESEAATARKNAAALEKEQAKQVKSKSPTTITDEQVLEAKEKANALELEAAKKRQTAAMAELDGKDIVVSDEDVKDIGKVQKIKEENQELISNGTQEQGDGLRRIVDGTEDTADSTVLVAEQTDELATVTGDIVPAQTDNLDNIVTTATLNDAIVGTTGDIHGSTIDTAMSQEQINQLQEEEKFLREQLNAKLAQENAAINSDISQTGKKRYTKDQALDEAFGDGTPENPGYTRDKNGHILFDPELDADGKKQPTTMTESQIKKKKRGMRREKVGKVSGKATGALGAATMVAGMAGAPPQVTAALGAATTVAQFAPMLAGMGPVGWAAAGIMAVGAGAYMLNQHFNKMAAESAKFVLATSATRDSMKKMGEMTGKVGASQIMDRRRQGSQYGQYNESYKVPEKFGKKFMSSDLGKQEKKTYKENVQKFGSAKAADDLGLKLAAQIADGVIDQEQAESISQALALSLKDQKIQLQVTGRIRTLLGPNGENLEKDPLDTRLNLIANARLRSGKTLQKIEKDGKDGKSQRKDIAALAALNMNNLELSTMMADQLEIHYETQKKKLEAELASTTNAQKRLELEEKIKQTTADASLATETMNANLGRQIAIGQRDFNKFYSGSVWGGQATREDAFFDGQSAAVKAAYKGTDQEKSADKFLKETKGFETGATYANTKVNGQYVTNGLQSGKAAQQFQAKLQMLVGSKVLSPDEAMSYTKMFAGKLGQLNQLLTLSLTERGSAKTKELFNMFAGFKSKATATKLVKYMVQLEKGPKFDANMETLKSLQALDGLTIDMELLLKGGPAVLEEIERRQGLLEKLNKETQAAEKKSGKQGTAKDFVKKAGEANPEDKALFDALLLDADRMEKLEKLSTDARTEYLQKLSAGYAYEKTLNADQIAADAELYADTQMYTRKDLRLLDETSQAYKDARLALLADYNSQTAKDRAITNLQVDVASGIDVKTGNDDGTDTKTERDTTYDELNKRLRNVRNSAIDAAGGMKELQRAIAATGSKAIGNKFKGLEQQLIKMGQTSQFTDYLASLDTKDLKKFAYTATAKDVKNKKGKQKYTQVDPETGKMVTKYQKFKAGDTVLTQAGRDMEQGYKKAIIGDYNKAQLQSVTLAKQEIAARGKLLALGFDELDIQTMLADENYKTLIATGKVAKAELETNAALTKQARIRNQINGAVAGQKDLQKTTDNQKRIPEVVKMMQDGGMSAEAIRSAISDPAMLDTLINGMDNFGTLAKDAQDEFNHLLSQIEDIPERKIIEIVFTQTREEKIINAATAAAEMFDAYKMIDENTLTNKEGNTFAGLQVKIEDLNNQAKIAQNAINLTQSKIDDMQKEVDADQRNIETNFTRPIEKKQREIDKLTRSAELNFTRPIQALQERSAVLSHDLDVMNKAAEAINEKYDKQQEALTKVAEINQQIINQQQQQLGLADALSQGDISAAAKAVQDIRATNASNYATSAQDALQKARENEVGGLRGGVSGKTQKEIEAEQWDISQKTYDLELKKAAVDKEILAIQDQIYTLEQSKQVAMDAIQVKTDAIAKITFGTLLDQQNKLKAINDQVLPLQSQSDLLAAQITANDRNRIIQGQTRAEWDLTLKAAQASEKLAKGELATALAGVSSVSGGIKGAWDSIKSSYDAIKDKSITITQHIVTTYGAALGLPDPNAGKTDPNAGKADPAKSPGAAWISDGKGGWKKPDKPSGDYGWDDTKGWVKGYYGSTPPPNPSNGYGTNDSAAEANMRAKALEETKRLEAVAKKAEEERLAALEKQRLQAAAKADGLARRYGGYALSSGGLVPKYFAAGGYARGTDTVPAMLTPGEFVMSRYAVNTHGTDRMKAINSGASVGDSVYNYNLSVNVKSDANPNEIAKTVIAQIKQIDSQRMRGTRI